MGLLAPREIARRSESRTLATLRPRCRRFFSDCVCRSRSRQSPTTIHPPPVRASVDVSCEASGEEAKFTHFDS